MMFGLERWILVIGLTISGLVTRAQDDISYKKYVLDLNGIKSGAPSRFYGNAHLAAAPNGQAHYVAWNETRRIDKSFQVRATRITSLDASFLRTAEDIVLDGYVINDILLPNNSEIVVLAGRVNHNTYIKEYPNELYVLKLDLKGKILWKKLISGGEGHGPGASWPDYDITHLNLEYNGSEYAAFFSLKRNFAQKGQKDDIHQIDKFVVLSEAGQILEDRGYEWTASHSNKLYLNVNEKGEFTTITTGDGSPYGVQYYNRNKKINKVVWPQQAKARATKYEEVAWVADAGVCAGVFNKNGYDYVMINTDKTDQRLNANEYKSEQDNRALVLLKLDDQGETISTHWLNQDRLKTRARMMPFGENILVVNSVYSQYDKNAPFGSDFDRNAILRVVDFQGRTVVNPIELNDAIYSEHSDKLVTLPDGSVAWATIRYKDQFKIEIVKVSPGGSIANHSSQSNSEDVSSNNMVAKPQYHQGSTGQTGYGEITIDFTQSSENVQGVSAVYTSGSEMTAQGALVNGEYSRNKSEGLAVYLNEFNYDNFTIEAKFKADRTQRAPVFSLSASCRHLAFYLEESGMLSLTANNGDIKEKTRIPYEANKWYIAKIRYASGVAHMYLNDVLVASKAVSFSEICSMIGADIHATNYGNGDTFKGYIQYIRVNNNH